MKSAWYYESTCFIWNPPDFMKSANEICWISWNPQMKSTGFHIKFITKSGKFHVKSGGFHLGISWNPADFICRFHKICWISYETGTFIISGRFHEIRWTSHKNKWISSNPTGFHWNQQEFIKSTDIIGFRVIQQISSDFTLNLADFSLNLVNFT